MKEKSKASIAVRPLIGSKAALPLIFLIPANLIATL